jgi:hypothetical protein
MSQSNNDKYIGEDFDFDQKMFGILFGKRKVNDSILSEKVNDSILSEKANDSILSEKVNDNILSEKVKLKRKVNVGVPFKEENISPKEEKIYEEVKINDIKLHESIGDMNNVLNTFNIDVKLFCNLISKYNGIIAGSSSLFSFINNTNDNIDKSVGDIDIWIPINRNVTNGQYVPWIGDILPSENDVVRDINYFLSKYDYSRIYNRYDIKENENSILCNEVYFKNNRFNRIISRVITFKNNITNKQIQLICCKTNHETILKTFDFSFCATAYKPEENNLLGKFISVETEMTKRKIGYKMNVSTSRELERAIKYSDRGYTIFETKEEADLYFNNIGTENIEINTIDSINVVYKDCVPIGFTKITNGITKFNLF